MRTIIAGSRSYSTSEQANAFRRLIEDIITENDLEITKVVSGKARGADLIGEFWAKARSIPVKEFPADWKMYGRAAGHLRNAQMAEYADQAIVIWDGKSPGSRNMIQTMKGLGKPVYTKVL